MNRYIVVYHSPASAVEQMMESTPEEQKEGMKVWMQWADKMGDALLDLGTPLTGGQRLSQDGVSVPVGDDTSGYSIIQAESMDAALRLLDGHPHLAWNKACWIEVHEAMELMLDGQDLTKL